MTRILHDLLKFMAIEKMFMTLFVMQNYVMDLTSYDVDLVFNDSSRSTNVFHGPCL